MLNPRSPLLVRPVPRLSYASWLFRFWRSAKPDAYSAGLAAMVAFSRRVVEDFDELATRCSFEMHKEGLLLVGRSRASLNAELEVLRDQRMLGYQGDVAVLGRAEALEHEPSLDPAIAGAVFLSDERHVRPESFTAGLVSHLQANRGVEIREHSRVSRIASRGGVWSLNHESGSLEVDRVILAGGVSTAEFLRALGVRLPLRGAKGFSLTTVDPPFELRGPIYLLESKVGVSPYDGVIRVAGTLELGSRDLGLNRGRIAAIEGAAKRNLRDWNDDLDVEAWAGCRPLLPDGLPAIGPVPGHKGLYVATGHGMLGITLAPTTARVLAGVVLDEAPFLELAPFTIARFDNRGQGADLPF